MKKIRYHAGSCSCYNILGDGRMHKGEICHVCGKGKSFPPLLSLVPKPPVKRKK